MLAAHSDEGNVSLYTAADVVQIVSRRNLTLLSEEQGSYTNPNILCFPGTFHPTILMCFTWVNLTALLGAGGDGRWGLLAAVHRGRARE